MVKTPVHIRSDTVPSAEACLLGTNVVIPLGLMVPDEGVEARGGTEQPSGVVPRAVSQAPVRLVRAQRIPARCAVVVTATAKETLPVGAPALFEPGQEWCRQTALLKMVCCSSTKCRC